MLAFCPLWCNLLDSLRPCGPQHARLLCPSLPPGIRWSSCPWTFQSPHLLSPPYPPAPIFPSINVFSSESALHIRWPKYWSFSFSISPSYEYSGLISFRTDWFDLLFVQGTLKSLLQYHSSKASVFWCSAFFMVQLSTQLILHPACIWVYTELTLWHPRSKLHSNLRDCLASLDYWEGWEGNPAYVMTCVRHRTGEDFARSPTTHPPEWLRLKTDSINTLAGVCSTETLIHCWWSVSWCNRFANY